MLLSDFDFNLPEHLIAQYPLAQRSASRLLDAAQPTLQDRMFSEFPSLLHANDLLIFNNTKVLKARLFAKKPTGGQVELLVERMINNHQALVHLRASNKPALNTQIFFEEQINATIKGRDGELFLLEFSAPVLTVLEQIGLLPLPPYIEHKPTDNDETRYQTVYATMPGAVAAPTAGLHFDETLLNNIRQQGIQTAFVTLHVGAGTFQPVRVENLDEHQMHTEHYQIPQATIDAIKTTQEQGGRVIAIGTTTLRALEGAALASERQHKTLQAGWSQTQIFITPGFRFKIADALITNFHLPKSTLLMLVSAFSGYEHIKTCYQHAIEQQYRFFSYGDAMWLTHQKHHIS
jgi:S-adenosylmethionine:tRNA ribosyltransferase-isomerase